MCLKTELWDKVVVQLKPHTGTEGRIVVTKAILHYCSNSVCEKYIIDVGKNDIVFNLIYPANRMLLRVPCLTNINFVSIFLCPWYALHHVCSLTHFPIYWLFFTIKD